VISLKTCSFYVQIDTADFTASIGPGLTWDLRRRGLINDFAEHRPPFRLPRLCALLILNAVSSLLKMLPTMRTTRLWRWRWKRIRSIEKGVD
jgi:hypothetical protein